MAIPTNRSEFSAYCLRRLGDPVIKINVSTSQVSDRIDEALYKFYERNYRGAEEIFILHNITTPEKILDSNGEAVLDSNGNFTYTTGTDTEKGYIQLPPEIIGVSNVLKPRSFSGISPGDFEFFMNELYAYINPASNSTGGGLVYYYLYQMNISLMNQLFDPDQHFDYNPITNKLHISGGLKNPDKSYGGVIVRAFKKIKGELEGDDDSETPIFNIWKDRWLQNYATALIKQQWASNMLKYQHVQLLGGVQMNGEMLWAQAQAEIEKLEKELEQAYELPVSFFMA